MVNIASICIAMAQKPYHMRMVVPYTHILYVWYIPHAYNMEYTYGTEQQYG